jgi:hypothetical protein
MILRSGIIAALFGLVLSHEVLGQVIVGPAPGSGYSLSGWRVTFRSGNVVVGVSGVGSTLYPSLAPYPSSTTPQTVVVPPARITINNNYFGGTGPLLGTPYDQDTRGYDLDQVQIKKSPPADAVEARPKPAEEVPSKPLPGVDVSKAKDPVRPGDPAEAPVKAPLPRPAPELPRAPDALADPQDESARLLHQGVAAFQDGEYGLGGQRFRQVLVLTPGMTRAYHLLAQAEFAVGKYRDAVDAIHAGMNVDKQWPRMAFQPRLELYRGRDPEYGEHLKRLADAVAANPNNATLLFLVAHQLWFDGQRKDALALFQRARPLAEVQDRPFIDAFLQAGGPGQLAKA